MIFKKEMMLTKVEQSTSKKGNTYLLVSLLDVEDGKTVTVMFKGEKFPVSELAAFDNVVCDFDLNIGGTYTNLFLKDIKKVA